MSDDAVPDLPCVIEHLTDGRIRYKSADGIVTGWQVGQYAVREQMHRLQSDAFCVECGRLWGRAGELVCAIDLLNEPARLLPAKTREAALMLADMESVYGDREDFDGYLCSVANAELDGLPIQSYREWSEQQREAG